MINIFVCEFDDDYNIQQSDRSHKRANAYIFQIAFLPVSAFLIHNFVNYNVCFVRSHISPDFNFIYILVSVRCFSILSRRRACAGDVILVIYLRIATIMIVGQMNSICRRIDRVHGWEIDECRFCFCFALSTIANSVFVSFSPYSIADSSNVFSLNSNKRRSLITFTVHHSKSIVGHYSGSERNNLADLIKN